MNMTAIQSDQTILEERPESWIVVNFQVELDRVLLAAHMRVVEGIR